MDFLFTVYENVIKMITKYRKMELIDPQLSKDDFEKNIQVNKYIIVNARYLKESKINDISSFYILHHNEMITRKAPEFKKILDKISNNIKNIYFISSKELSPHVYKIVISRSHQFNIKIYPHKIFAFELPMHDLCSRHEIMDEKDIAQLLLDLNLRSKYSLPRIIVGITKSDPQCAWIGAMPDDVIRITRNTTNGESIMYRVVRNNTNKTTSTLNTHKKSFLQSKIKLSNNEKKS